MKGENLSLNYHLRQYPVKYHILHYSVNQIRHGEESFQAEMSKLHHQSILD